MRQKRRNNDNEIYMTEWNVLRCQYTALQKAQGGVGAPYAFAGISVLRRCLGPWNWVTVSVNIGGIQDKNFIRLSKFIFKAKHEGEWLSSGDMQEDKSPAVS